MGPPGRFGTPLTKLEWHGDDCIIPTDSNRGVASAVFFSLLLPCNGRCFLLWRPRERSPRPLDLVVAMLQNTLPLDVPEIPQDEWEVTVEQVVTACVVTACDECVQHDEQIQNVKRLSEVTVIAVERAEQCLRKAIRFAHATNRAVSSRGIQKDEHAAPPGEHEQAYQDLQGGGQAPDKCTDPPDEREQADQDLWESGQYAR